MANETELKTYLPAGMPAPEATRDGLDREFWEAAKRHELVVQKCNSCGTFQFVPEWILLQMPHPRRGMASRVRSRPRL